MFKDRQEFEEALAKSVESMKEELAKTNEKHIQQVKDALQELESPLSAHHLVLSHHLGRDLTEQEMDNIESQAPTGHGNVNMPSNSSSKKIQIHEGQAAPDPKMSSSMGNPDEYHDNHVHNILNSMGPKSFRNLVSDIHSAASDRMHNDSEEQEAREEGAKHTYNMSKILSNNKNKVN